MRVNTYDLSWRNLPSLGWLFLRQKKEAAAWAGFRWSQASDIFPPSLRNFMKAANLTSASSMVPLFENTKS